MSNEVNAHAVIRVQGNLIPQGELKVKGVVINFGPVSPSKEI